MRGSLLAFALAACYATPVAPVANTAPAVWKPRERACPVLVSVETRVDVRRVPTMCIRKPPPTLVLLGDETVDRFRREEHRLALVAWSMLWYEVCAR
jgi:hypothetical protein